MQVERKCKLAELGLGLNLILLAFFQFVQLDDLQLIHIGHQFLCFLQGLGCPDFAVFPRALDDKYFLQMVVFNGVGNFNVGY